MKINDIINPHGYLSGLENPVTSTGKRGMRMGDIINQNGYLSGFDNPTIVFGRRTNNGFHQALNPEGQFSAMDEPHEIIGEGKVLHKLVAKTSDEVCHTCAQYANGACIATHGGNSAGGYECSGGSHAIPGIT